jgi:hypothetical protein
MTVRQRGGGHKKRYRIIDFKRNKDGIPGTIKTIEYDPNRSAFIALVFYADGEKRYILAPRGIKVGDTILAGATATPDVVVDIQEKLQFKEYNLIQRSFTRENLTYVVLQEEDKNRRILELLERNPGSSIIYVRSRKGTKDVARFLIENQIIAHF